METLQALAVHVWGRTETKFIVGHVLLNLMIALWRTGSSGAFNLRKLPGFMTEKLLPYLAVYVTALGFQDAAGIPGLSVAAWGVIQTSLLAQTVDSLGKLGLPLPEKIISLVGKDPIDFEPDRAFERVMNEREKRYAEKEQESVGD